MALHSSDPVSVYLSATARMAHPSLGAVDGALYDERSVVRFHAMRRTLWVATPAVARDAHASSTIKLLAPEHVRFVKLLADNGIPDGDRWIADAKEQTLAALHRAGEATTRQLGEAVPDLRHPLVLAPGKNYTATQGAHVRVLLQLGFEGSIVRTRPIGTWIASQYRWAATDAWLGGGIAGMDPARSFGRARSTGGCERSVRARPRTCSGGPDGTVGTRRAALSAAGAVPVEAGGQPAWLAADDADPVAAGEPWVALLPGLDPATMGWKQRDWYLDPAHVPLLFDRNGNGGPSVWVDGRIVGSWVQRPDGSIAVGYFGDVATRRRRQIDRAAGALSDLLGETRFTVRFPAPVVKDLLATDNTH